MTDWIDSEEVLRRLRIRAQTLYAYVSRGLVERREDPADPRRSLYSAADVGRLRERRTRPRSPSAVAAGAMAWGEPTIRTRISGLSHGRFEYRGRDVLALSAGSSLEDVAGLLWEEDAVSLPEGEASGQGPWEVLSELAAAGRPAAGRAGRRLAAEAGALVAALAASFGFGGAGAVHGRIAQCWGLDAAGADLVRRMLVLMADHELNPSTFAARVVASTGASLAAAVLAGFGAMSGPRHGGAAALLTGLVDEAGRSDPVRAVDAWLARSHLLPGFGHPLYPDGDPRATAILDRVETPALLAEVAEAAFDATGARPNCDFALVAAAGALGLPREAPFALFTVARCVGWTAHAMEQLASGELIRPRGRYEAP